ncbi:pyridoxal phosphate-dependent aminotransferase [Halomicrococcus sp. NG-SE-24]|uniref:pyridoxal phosphate-dependent aminotransferase n=1 Tax=Halomicrococcus sp. NG-SE-24 TaxID=3436928 RepID=UPI003D966E7D
MFPDIEYLEWITGRPERADHDLGSSDLRRRRPEGEGVVPPALENLPAPPSDVGLDALLADAYGVGTENVLVTAGATHANFLAVAAALDGDEEAPDDEKSRRERVLVEKPGYEPLTATPQGFGATVDRFRRTPDDDYALDPDRIAGAVTDATQCITVTSRHNPSGRLSDRETLTAASGVAVDAGIPLLVDEVYAPFDGERGDGPLGGPTAADLPNAVVTNSLTKFHGLGSLQVGWLVADESFVERARSVGFHLPDVAGPSVTLARRALHGEGRRSEAPADADAGRLDDDSRARIAENHDLLASFVADRDDLHGFVAPGCTYGFLAHESADGDEIAEAAWEAGVLVVPGRFFADADRFRLSLGRDSSAARAGLDAFGDVLDSL